MARDVDERKKRKALRKLRKAAMLAEQGLGPELSDWEKQFLEEVESRIETYGSAFNDPEKGGQGEPLSALQTLKLREIDKKTRGKSKTGLRRKPFIKPETETETEAEEVELEARPPQEPLMADPTPAKLKLVSADEVTDSKSDKREHRSDKKQPQRLTLRVIKGGAGSE